LEKLEKAWKSLEKLWKSLEKLGKVYKSLRGKAALISSGA
jgi:hypothetical protein